MRIAKPAIDVGLHTTRKDEMLQFWQREIGLPFQETLPVGRGTHQLRHGIGNSVLKINHNRDPLPEAPPAGYRQITIARAECRTPRELTDPDGNRVMLVPVGHEGIEQLQVHVAVRDVDAQRHFYGQVLGLDATDDGRFRCGASLLAISRDPSATADSQMRGIGYRYLTIQVFDVVGEHAGVLSRGGLEGAAPIRLGDVAYISFVRDPDGNWIEISQRKSITGSLD
jgi:catechol 2,3-dioxygenase-like lactoylglutathione lyase family enzyme